MTDTFCIFIAGLALGVWWGSYLTRQAFAASIRDLRNHTDGILWGRK